MAIVYSAGVTAPVILVTKGIAIAASPAVAAVAASGATDAIAEMAKAWGEDEVATVAAAASSAAKDGAIFIIAGIAAIVEVSCSLLPTSANILVAGEEITVAPILTSNNNAHALLGEQGFIEDIL